MTESATAETKSENPSSNEKLWAGKYKSPEEMETALLAQNKEVYKLMDQNKHLTTQVKSVAGVPESYKVPDNLTFIKDEVPELTVVAKNSGLTQENFEKMLSELNTKRSVEQERFESEKSSIGSENLTVLTDYVKKNYPESLHNTVLSKLITDSNARKEAMNDRDRRLNSSIPGINGANSGAGGRTQSDEPYDGHAELQKLAREVEAQPSNSRLREKLIRLAADVGHARQDKK